MNIPNLNVKVILVFQNYVEMLFHKSVLTGVSSQQNKIKKSRIFNKSPARQTENVAGSV
jgi:hypothetical protein